VKKQQREQVSENLRKLADEVATQIHQLERSLGRIPGVINEPIGPHGQTKKYPKFSELGLEAEDPFSVEIRKQPGFVWLFGHPDFKLAYEHFENRIEQTNVLDGEIVLLKTKFIYSFAVCGRDAFCTSSQLPATISKEKKDRAVKLAQQLLAFADEGAGRDDFLYMDALRHPLRRFIEYFDNDTPREYPADRQKYILRNLAFLLHGCGLKKKEVVILVEYGVGIFDFDRSLRQVQRYVYSVFQQ
jgi:hypothetical protein